MVEAMGGTESDHYHEFRKQCYTAFLHLRRYDGLTILLARNTFSAVFLQHH